MRLNRISNGLAHQVPAQAGGTIGGLFILGGKTMSPMKPMPPCRWRGCGNIQDPNGRGYCREHMQAVRQQDTEHRGSARQRGYTTQYERARAWVLKRHPLCPICKAEGRINPSTRTHHIKHLADGGSNSTSNLFPCCEACHTRLHSKEGPALMEKARGSFF